MTVEKIVTFGKDNHLTGILTQPEIDASKGDMPSVILLNAGLLHRVGPFRFYVDIARRLASNGFMVLRFDLSGIGDSSFPTGERFNEKYAVNDIKSAMDFLETHKNVTKFVLMGICSGADKAHKCAVMDERVTGAVFLDGYVYRTWRFFLKHYCLLILMPGKWSGLLKRKLTVFHDDPADSPLPFYEMPAKKDVILDIERLIGRGVALLYIYSGEGLRYNYREQFKDMFGSIDFKDKVQHEFYDNTDHIYTIISDRERLMTRICDWMQEKFKPNSG